MEEHFDGEGEWRKGPWTPQEDKLLVDHINLHGEGKWNSVSKLTGLRRCGKSCRLRWVNYLRPDLKRGNITEEEETLIQELHAFWGNRWSTIARSLPGRTDNEIKNYWRTHFKASKPPPSKSIEKARARFLIRRRQCRRGEEEEKGRPEAEAAAAAAAAAEGEEDEEEEEEALRAVLAEQAMLAEEMMGAFAYPAAAPGLVFAADCEWSDEEESWGSLWNLDDVTDGSRWQIE